MDQILLGFCIGFATAVLKEFGPAMLDFILDFPPLVYAGSIG
jgi:hypothetical protein